MKPKYEISICAIVRNEAKYILEWIAYHKALFVEHFYIYDNESSDGTTDILGALHQAGLITHVPWPDAHPAVLASGLGPQVPAYNDFLRFREDSIWVAFIDVDEFLVPTEAQDLREWIKLYEDYGGIGINWRMFGSSGQTEYVEGLMMDRFYRRAVTDFAPNRHLKTIARCDHIDRVDTHICHLRSGVIVDILGVPVDISRDGVHDRVCEGSIQLNHYFTRSRQEWDLKRARGRATRPAQDPDKFRNDDLFVGHDRNDIEDRNAARFRNRTLGALALIKEMISCSL